MGNENDPCQVRSFRKKMTWTVFDFFGYIFATSRDEKKQNKNTLYDYFHKSKELAGLAPI